MIRVSQPMLGARERAYVLDCLDRNELSGGAGRYVSQLEDAFAQFCGVPHALACCNGTAALHLALLGLGVKPGDSVIVPALTYVATANAVKHCGATPIFCDVLPDTWCIDGEDALRMLIDCRKSGRKVVGIIAVHLFGVPADMGYLTQLAAHYGIWVAEDAAEAHGAYYNDQRVGSIGKAGAFSFYGNKILTCGEGGIVTTVESTVADFVRLYRGQGVDTSVAPYYHSVIGYNYRLTNMQAAVACGQLEAYSSHATARQRVAQQYARMLDDRFQRQAVTARASSAHWMTTVLLPDGVDRRAVMSALSADGIETRPMFIPLTALPPYNQQTPSVAWMLGRRGLMLPTHGGLLEEDVACVATSLKRASEVAAHARA